MPDNDPGFEAGYTEAERQMYELEDGTLVVNGKEYNWYQNPFVEGTEAYRGFEEGFYDFTQK